jgi:hypothetical protein
MNDASRREFGLYVSERQTLTARALSLEAREEAAAYHLQRQELDRQDRDALDAAHAGAEIGVLIGQTILFALIFGGLAMLHSGLSGMADGLHMMAGALR